MSKWKKIFNSNRKKTVVPMFIEGHSVEYVSILCCVPLKEVEEIIRNRLTILDEHEEQYE